MSGSDRNFSASSIALWIIALAVWSALVWSLAEQQRYRSGYTDYATGQSAADAREEIESRCLTLSSPEDRATCVESVIASEREDRRAEYDLEAQQNMAKWAVIMAAVAGVQTIIGLAGTLLLIRTLRQGQDANRIARENGFVQMRAWVSVGEWNLEGAGANGRVEGLYFSLNWKNAGGTPAINLMIATGRADDAIFAGGAPNYEGSVTGTSLAPQMTFNTKIPMTVEQVIASAGDPIRIRFAVRYETVFEGRGTMETDVTFHVTYRGLAGAEEIRAGNIGAGNFLIIPSGQGKMT